MNQKARSNSSGKLKRKPQTLPIDNAPSNDENYSDQSEQYADINSIALHIIEIVSKELNSIDSKSLLTNLMDLLKSFQTDVVSQVDESQYENSEFEALITKNLETIMNYFIKCLQIFDNVKSNSIENLKTCLTELFQIISNELAKKEENNNHSNTPIPQNNFNPDALLSKEQSFVDLINILSGSIKEYSKNVRSISKKVEGNAETAVNGIEQCKISINDLIYQMNTFSYKNSLQTLKEKAKMSYKIAESLEEINKEIQKQSKIIVGYNTNFFDNAKEVFKNLKTLHNDKMKEIKSLCDEFSTKSMNNTTSFNSNPMNNSNTFTASKNYDRISHTQANMRKNQSVSPTRQRVTSSASYVKYNEKLIDQSQSSEHMSIKAKRTKKPLNILTTNCDSSISNITVVNKKDSMITELNEQNKELQNEMKKISSENKKLKQSLSSLKISYEKLSSSMITNEAKQLPKSKSLRNFITKGDKITPTLCNQCVFLSDSILSFIQSMKDLQTSIVKKAPNVSEMKKDFERQKHDLHQIAEAIREGNSIDVEETKPKKEKVDNSTKINDSLQTEYERLIKTCKDYESVIQNLGEQIKDKDKEISKLNNDISKASENKKSIPGQAKLKELENKINAYKSENDSLKKNISEYEEKIKGLNEDILNKDKILSMPKVDNKYNESLKENEKLNALLEETKKLNVKYKKQIDDLMNVHKADEGELKKLKNEKEENELRSKTIMDELSTKAHELLEIKSKQGDYEAEIKSLKKLNEKMKNDYDALNTKNTNEVKASLISSQNEVLTLKKQNEKLQSKLDSLNKNLQSLTKELNAQKEIAVKSQSDFKTKISLKENEISELKQSLIALQKTFQDKNQIKSPSFTTELGELSSMIKNIHTTLNSKHKQARIQISSQEVRRNPNDAFMMYDQEDKEEEIDSILSNVNNSIEGNSNLNDSITKINQLMEKNRNEYTEINQMINILFNLFEKKKIKDSKKEEDDDDIPSMKEEEENNKILNMQKAAQMEELQKIKEENQFLKNFFTECTTTIFESIKQQAPHMIDEESDISFNIVSGPNSPINLLDSKNKSPKEEKSKQNQSVASFDPEMISSAVAKFKAYNQEINEQIKKLTEEKEEIEKEAHHNLVKANAYKTALDDAITKMNNNMANEEGEASSKNKEVNVANIEGRAFTVEDLENPPSENSGVKSSANKELSGKGGQSLAEIKKINNDLITIQNNLMKKLNSKTEEIDKLQETINNLLAINNTNSNMNSSNIKEKMVISAEKYHQLLQLYTNEQEKNHELRSSYYSFINEFTEFVQNGKINQHPPQSDKNKKGKIELTLGNNDNNSQNSKENNVGIEDDEEVSEGEYNPSLDGELHKDNNMLIQNQEGKKNKTHGQLNVKQKDYFGMLNEKDLQSNHSGQVSEVQINEILLEKKNLEEQEELLMTQLNAVKAELKETREQVKQLIIENTHLKEELSDTNTLKKDDIIGTLRNALERLIYEIQLTNKVKEFLTVILRVVGYSDDQISTIYQAKEKKKGFFNMFK